MRATKALIFSDNLRHNVNEIKKNLKPGVKLCCAVKADGYGNDAVNSARIFEELGASYLAIACVEEGIELRKAGIKTELLLLSLADYTEFTEIIENSITPLVFDEEYVTELSKTACELKKDVSVFLAVDTGMGRIGCYPEEAGKIADFIKNTENVTLKGMITHFAVSDGISKESLEYTKKQHERFLQAVKNVEDRGIDSGIKTCSASAAGISIPEYQMDMIRPGIILYGYYADEVTQKYLKEKEISLNLKPVLQFETKVCAIRRFEKGMSVSYGRTWKSERETDIAVLPAGYADGLLRRNSPGLKVTINGKAYPVVGRICMDQCMVDIGLNNKDVKRWDKAVIFGPKISDGGESLFDADDIARMTGTISYEIMTSLTKRVKRIIV